MSRYEVAVQFNTDELESIENYSQTDIDLMKRPGWYVAELGLVTVEVLSGSDGRAVVVSRGVGESTCRTWRARTKSAMEWSQQPKHQLLYQEVGFKRTAGQ